MALRALVASVIALATARPPLAAAPWEGAPFAADPKAILEAADALPAASGPVDVLLEEGVFRFDARGAVTFTHRLVYRPLLPDAALRWAHVEQPWEPWHQARPEIRARVIGPRGEAHDLDPATLAERGTGDADGEVWSDRRVVAGPLPAVHPGSIVEELATIRDTAPLFDGGVVHRFWLGQPHPIRLSRLLVEAPASLPLRWVVRGVDARPTERVRDGVRTLLVERRDVPAAPRVEPFAPRELPPAPVVLFGWGRSWADVAERYGALAERQLAGADLREAARAALGGKEGREEAIRRVVAWVQANVRYTGLELGASAIVPAPPGETLKRRFGDCKDLSLLVVGLLREAGVEARVALLRTAWPDLVPELPGLGQFDHAIVRVEAREPLWIDPTDRFSPPGKLPPVDQGRLALVTGPGQRGLVRTPEPGPAENQVRTVREVELAELGPGRIVETRTFTGALAAAARAYRARVPAGQRDALDERYAREVFRSELFLGSEVKGEDDPDAPLVVRIEADRSAVVDTRDDEVDVPVTPDPVFEPLPGVLTGRGEEGDEARRPPPRTQDLVLAVPYRSEIVYRLRPPAGFRASPLPADATERFGPATFERRAALEPDGSVTATFRFDTGGRRIRARDADALARRVDEIFRGRSPRVVFERTAAALLSAGRVREGLAEIRRLVALHPREAMHHLHLAIALLQLGFTQDAASEARRAIALEPDRAWAHRVLGFVLEHDAVGRLHGPGFDRAAAIAAYEAAREKDPGHVGGRAALADLLARDAAGVRFAPGADLGRAIEEYRSIRTELGERRYDGSLIAALFAAGRHAEAAALARETPPGGERDAILVASIAATDGAAAAEEVARGLGDGRRDALRGAGGLLAGQRRYAPAAALLAAAARGAPNPAELLARADTFAGLRPWPAARDEGDEAARLVKRLLVATIAAEDPAKEIAALLAPRALEGGARAALEAGLLLPAPAARRTLQEAGIPPDVLLDLVLSKLELVRDGDPASGLRVRIRFPFAPAERGSTVYLARERGALRLVATDLGWPLLGEEIERRAAGGDLAAARRWLGWAREAVPGAEGDPSSPAGMVAALWGAGGDLAAARRTGAALAAFADRGGRTVPVLAAALRGARGDPERRALRFALGQALRLKGDAAQALETADALLADDPSSRPAFALKAWALRRLQRREALWPAADAILARLPDDPDVLAVTGSTAVLMGDLEGAARAWRRLIDAGRAPPGVYNNAAWLELFRDPAGEQALDWAHRAVDQARERSYPSLNTLAAAYAVQDKPAEAREVFLHSLEGGRVPSGADWFVFGRIAEAWGLEAAARAAYERVGPELDEGEDDPTSAYHLARRALARLDAAAPAGSAESPAAPARGGETPRR